LKTQKLRPFFQSISGKWPKFAFPDSSDSALEEVNIEILMTPAPIILFTYNRPNHTQQTIEALQKNELAAASELFIYSDAAKDENAKPQVDALRNYLHSIKGFKNVTLIERDTNYGLARNIIEGVGDIVSRYGRVIVLEDDIVPSLYFLRYMNDGLEFYKDEEKVISIHAYLPPVKPTIRENFFLKGADCWGWATWKRGWDHFEADGQKLLDALLEKKLAYEFDLDRAYPFTRMLIDQIKGKNNSWAIRWQASAFVDNKLTLYPKKSLVQNIGNDGSGIHCNVSNEYDVQVAQEQVPVHSIPVEVNKVARRAFVQYFRSIKPKLLTRISYKLKKAFQ